MNAPERIYLADPRGAGPDEPPIWSKSPWPLGKSVEYLSPKAVERVARRAMLFAWKRLMRIERGIIPVQDFEEVYADFLASKNTEGK